MTPPGPGPKPPGPTHPTPTAPPPRGPLSEPLDSIDLLLRVCQLVADRALTDAEPSLRMALAERLRLTRRAVADLAHTETPGREGIAAVRGARPGPFSLPQPPTFEIGPGRPYDALPRAR